MEKNDICYETYISILKRELVPAMGCTEPIALAYCAAKARAVAGSDARMNGCEPPVIYYCLKMDEMKNI